MGIILKSPYILKKDQKLDCWAGDAGEKIYRKSIDILSWVMSVVLL